MSENKTIPEGLPSVYEVYHTCRSRDLCLRYLQENPKQWIDCKSTPCPCNHKFYKEVWTYGKLIEMQEQGFHFSHPLTAYIKPILDEQGKKYKHKVKKLSPDQKVLFQ